MHAAALLFILELGHFGGYCLYVFCGIVGKTIASEVFLYLAFGDFAKDFVGTADTVIIDNSIVVIFIKKVVVAVLRG